MTPQEKLAAIQPAIERLGDDADGKAREGVYLCTRQREDLSALLALAPALRRFAERVLKLHKRSLEGHGCEHCDWDWPCPTVQAAQEELGE